MMEGRQFSGKPKQAQFSWGVRQNLGTLKIQCFLMICLGIGRIIEGREVTVLRRLAKTRAKTLARQGFQGAGSPTTQSRQRD